MDTKIVMSEGITPGARQYKWYHLLADNGESLLGFYAEPVMFAWAKLTGAFERIPWQEGSPVSSSGNYRIESQGCVNITYLRKA